MLIAAIHQISSPGQFWPTFRKAIDNLVQGNDAQLIQVLPSKDIFKAISVWEAASIDILDVWLRGEVGTNSDESYFEIDSNNSVGLPL